MQLIITSLVLYHYEFKRSQTASQRWTKINEFPAQWLPFKELHGETLTSPVLPVWTELQTGMNQWLSQTCWWFRSVRLWTRDFAGCAWLILAGILISLLFLLPQ